MSKTAEPTSAAVVPLFAELRRTEYPRLDTAGHVYLDRTGAGPSASGAGEVAFTISRETLVGGEYGRVA